VFESHKWCHEARRARASFACAFLVILLIPLAAAIRGGPALGAAALWRPHDAPARFQKLDNPSAVALNASGDLLIADTANSRIRRVDAAGMISVLVRNGKSGVIGDGGPANLASLAAPNGVAVDRYGNIFIADTGNHRIRCVDTSGAITTIAGTGRAGFSGDDGAALTADLNGPTGASVGSNGDL
jgi:NHL repeat-containing protein